MDVGESRGLVRHLTSVPNVKLPCQTSRAVKLQKQLGRRYGGKDYAKWLVVIPPNLVDKLGWAEGEELDPQIDGHQLRLKRVQKSKRGGA